MDSLQTVVTVIALTYRSQFVLFYFCVVFLQIYNMFRILTIYSLYNINPLQKYMNPLKSTENANIADAQIVDEIFFMVPAILNVHERFLDEMRRRLDAWEPLQKVGDAFIEVVGFHFHI